MQLTSLTPATLPFTLFPFYPSWFAAMWFKRRTGLKQHFISVLPRSLNPPAADQRISWVPVFPALAVTHVLLWEVRAANLPPFFSAASGSRAGLQGRSSCCRMNQPETLWTNGVLSFSTISSHDTLVFLFCGPGMSRMAFTFVSTWCL